MRAMLLSIRRADGASRRTSKRSGNALGATALPIGVAVPANSRKLTDVSTRRCQIELRTVTVPPSTGLSNGPRNDKSASTSERKPSG
jgi:hypothetical protein